jgi:hypothetical protein
VVIALKIEFDYWRMKVSDEYEMLSSGALDKSHQFVNCRILADPCHTRGITLILYFD